MALIEDTVGTLPYLLVDFDQHSYEAQDCFTRFMPKAKLDTAVRPIVLPSGHKALIANDRSVAELDRVLAAGARFIYLPAGPAYGRSPGDPYFDPFWARVNEAKAVICYHISEFHYQQEVASHWGWKLGAPFQFSAWQWQNTYGERPITDTLSALIFDNLFGRFPDIRVLVSEFGASWVPHFIRHMDKSRGMARLGPWLGGPLRERPSAIFKRHVRVVPYPEDDTVAL